MKWIFKLRISLFSWIEIDGLLTNGVPAFRSKSSLHSVALWAFLCTQGNSGDFGQV